MAKVRGRRKKKPFKVNPDGTKFFGGANEKATEVDFPILPRLGKQRKKVIDKRIEEAISATERRRRNLN